MLGKSKRIPLDSVVPAAQPDEGRVGRFAKMDSKTQPPIEINRGYVIDGNHRWFASYKRGDKSINATESNLPPLILNRWHKKFGNKER